MNIKEVTKQALIAVIYIVISMFLIPFSFGPLQFRLAETMMILPYYDKKYTFGLTAGCFFVNLYSPMKADIIFGTFATFLACMLISKLKKTTFIALIAGIVNGLIVGLELYYILRLPFFISVISVAVSEVLVVEIGLLVFSSIKQRVKF